MAWIVIVVASLALIKPETCLWIPLSSVNYLLMIIMFGMGLTLNIKDFVAIFRRPKDVLIGSAAQFVIMPSLAYLLGRGLNLNEELLTGVVLVGACPGGTASNVITYLSKGDVALSVGMTSVNTFLAPIVTPFIVWATLRASVPVDVTSMFLSILQVVVTPIATGLLINRYWSRYTTKITKALPVVSIIAIALTVATVVAHNASQILAAYWTVFGVVILHNLLGCLAGYLLGLILGLPLAKRKALSIEVGMQNSGLATSLATTSFPNYAMATVPGAIFSVWHNISGAILAHFFSKYEESTSESVETENKESTNA